MKYVSFDGYMEDMSDEEYYRLQNEYYEMSIKEH